MKKIILFLGILVSGSLFADEETREAVSNVQKQMQAPSFHQNAAKDSKEAAAVEQHVKTLSGSPENEQEMYNLASEVLGNMKDKSPEEMQKLLQDAQKNPEAFLNSWSPEQQKKLKELSERIPAGRKQAP
jgi:histidyl-tRNA synthetase